LQIFAEIKGNLKQLCFFSVNSSNFAGFLEKNCLILDITKWGGEGQKKTPDWEPAILWGRIFAIL